MSAVSKNVTPASSAASTTARVPFSSSRPPKLLQPRPTTVTWRGPSVRVRIAQPYRPDAALPPGCVEHAQPVAVRDPVDVFGAVARIPECLDELREPGYSAELRRNGGAVEVRPEGDVLDAHALDVVVDMPHDLADRRIRVVRAVGAQEGDGEVDACDAAGVADRLELLVRQVP